MAPVESEGDLVLSLAPSQPAARLAEALAGELTRSDGEPRVSNPDGDASVSGGLVESTEGDPASRYPLSNSAFVAGVKRLRGAWYLPTALTGERANEFVS